MTKTTQQLAIEKVSEPCLIKAGAGTGKTYTIVEKIAYLINNNICKPSEILCLTFSNEATNHLKQKVNEKLKTSSEITIKTFHSFCANILKEIGHLIKINPDFEILLPDDAKVLLHKYLDISPSNSNRYVTSISTAKDLGVSLEQIESYAENLKNNLGKIKDLDDYAKNLEFELKTLHLRPADTKTEKQDVFARKKEISQFLRDYNEYIKYRDFIDAWKKYDKLKKEKNYLDYSDLNFNVLKLFNSFGEDEISKRYKYIIIDEFQDTNKLQFDLIEFLAKKHKNVTVVGDPNQSVYGFRGSFRGIFSAFQEAFNVKKEDIIELNKSRRSPNKVLRVAHNLIKNNYEKPDECMLIENFENKEGSDIKIFELKNSAEESRKVAELVEDYINKGTPLHEICVLYRTHNQGRLIEEALRAKDIPIVSAGKVDLLQRPEIRTTVAYLSILNNLKERTGTGDQAWWSLFHYQNALTPEDSYKIGRYLKSHRDDDLSIDYATIIKLNDLDISSNGKDIIRRIVNKLGVLLKISNKSLPELILDVYEIVGLNRAFSHTRSATNVEGLMNLNNFYELAKNYYEMHGKDLTSFIKYLEILEKLGVEVDASKIKDINAVRLMTMHAVKGLEFDKVIVTNLADNRFPIERTANEPLIPKDLNPDIKRYLDSNTFEDDEKDEAIREYEKHTLLLEERRLCYVSFTRAKSDLIITYARSYNKEEDSTSASLFLNEIDYTNNGDVSIVKDNEEKCTIFAPCSMFEQYKSMLKKQLVESLDIDDINALMSRLITYHAVREGKVMKYDMDLNKLIDKKELDVHINKHHKKCSSLKMDKENFTFSPTALIVYDECPKKYELANIFQMPQRGAFEWSGASTGSFVHKLFEDGVKEMFKNKEQFVARAVEMSKLDEWKGVDLDDVNQIINIFWERHKGRYNEKTITEQRVNVDIDGLKFSGIIDRIDFIKGKDVEIIDYKTDKDAIEPKKRAWQLGFYAIASKNMDLNPIKLTLEMLRLDKPLEADVDEEGNVTAGRSKGFNIKDVEKELVECAKNVVKDYEGEFLPTTDDNKCRFCGYKFYCPKWEEK